MSEEYWALRRMQYRKMSRLCVMIDDAISHITFLSFSNNLFFICVQLLRSIRYYKFDFESQFDLKQKKKHFLLSLCDLDQ